MQDMLENILKRLNNEKSLAIIRWKGALACFNEEQATGCSGEIRAIERAIRIVEDESRYGEKLIEHIFDLSQD